MKHSATKIAVCRQNSTECQPRIVDYRNTSENCVESQQFVLLNAFSLVIISLALALDDPWCWVREISEYKFLYSLIVFN